MKQYISKADRDAYLQEAKDVYHLKASKYARCCQDPESEEELHRTLGACREAFNNFIQAANESFDY